MLELPEPIDARLLRVDVDDGVTLLAGRNAKGRVVFPLLESGSDWEETELPREGTLWSWTIQRFRPKSPPYAGPEAFEPYAVGYVDLGSIIVESRLIGAIDGFRIGMQVVLVPEPFMLADGTPRLTFAFAPKEAAA